MFEKLRDLSMALFFFAGMIFLLVFSEQSCRESADERFSNCVEKNIASKNFCCLHTYGNKWTCDKHFPK